MSDSAVSLYYPANLEALQERGASLVPLSSLDGKPLPRDLGALYIGGGFPETACAVLRGTGCGNGPDAITLNRVGASYAHLHAAGVPAWTDGMIRAARGYTDVAGSLR